MGKGDEEFDFANGLAMHFLGRGLETSRGLKPRNASYVGKTRFAAGRQSEDLPRPAGSVTPLEYTDFIYTQRSCITKCNHRGQHRVELERDA